MRMSSRHESHDAEGGFILFLTILLIAVLAVFAVEFGYLMRVRASMVENRRDDLAALMAARGGVEAARKALDEDDTTVDNLTELWATAGASLPYGDERGLVTVSIVDENSKLPLNQLVKRDAKGKEQLNTKLRKVVRRVLETLDEHISVSNAIIDWLDGNKAPLGGGGEAAYYMDLDPPCRPADGPVYALEELLWVRNVTPLLFYGDQEAEQLGLRDYLSTYGNAINVNTASREVLIAVFEDEAVADRIIEERGREPFDKIIGKKVTGKGNNGQTVQPGTDLQSRIPELDEKSFNKVKDLLTIGSTYFRVHARGMVGSATREVEAVLLRKKSGVKVVYYRVRR